jgi:hypothetical protein
MNFNYPLTLRFKLIALAPQLSVENSRGETLLYVKQKLLKLREAVNVFADATQKETLFRINADRIIDFRARYEITDVQGQTIGAIKQRGMKSLWRAHFDVEDNFGRGSYSIEEENPWVRVLDSLLESVPLIGALTGYVLHPTYLIKRADGGVVMTLKKQPALWEGRYELSQVAPFADADKPLLTLAVVMMVLLERSRG